MKTKLLITTPTLTAGSWVVIENLLPFLEKEFEAFILGLGEGRNYKNIPVRKLPFVSFEKMHPSLGSNIFFNVFYQLPLQLFVIYKIFTYKPIVLLSNGFGPLILSLPILWLLRIKVVIYYGTYLGAWLDYKIVMMLVRLLNTFVDVLFVNSIDSKNDAKKYIDIEKINIINHTTDLQAFDVNKRQTLRQKFNLKPDDLVVLHANRLVPSKNLPTLINLIETTLSKKTIASNKIKFYFAGEGAMLSDVKALSVKYPQNVLYFGKFGQVDKENLKKWLTIADITWTNAQTTYMSLSGVESLAMGTPILISNEIYHQANLVPKNLIPKNIGWVMPHDDMLSMSDLLLNCQKQGTNHMRKFCVNYAVNNFSTKNLEEAVEIMNRL